MRWRRRRLAKRRRSEARLSPGERFDREWALACARFGDRALSQWAPQELRAVVNVNGYRFVYVAASADQHLNDGIDW